VAGDALWVNVGSLADVPAEDLVITTSSPGGCLDATWRDRRTVPHSAVLDYWGGERVEVGDAQGPLWNGRLQLTDDDTGLVDEDVRVKALGYSANAGDVPRTSMLLLPGFAFPSSPEVVIRMSRDAWCPQISADNSHLMTTGAIVQSFNFIIGQTSSQLWDQMCTWGDNQQRKLYWHVWPTPRSGDLPFLELVPRPSAPEYFVSLWEGARIRQQFDVSKRYNEVDLYWSGSVVPRYWPNLADQTTPPPLGLGYRHALTVDYSQFLNNFPDADRIAQTLLAYYQVRRPIAAPIVIPASAVVQDASGRRVPLQRMRAGKIIHIRELKGRSGVGNQNQYDLYIAGTSYSVRTGAQRLTIEGHESLAAFQARYLRDGHFV
jgi:hypothetical protein